MTAAKAQTTFFPGTVDEFLSAVEENESLAVEFFVRNQPGRINDWSSTGHVAVVTAAGFGHYIILDHLLKNNADVNVQNKAGETALMAAAAIGDEGAVRLLLSKDADVTKTDKAGYTAIRYAQEIGFEKITALLEEAEDRHRKEMQRASDICRTGVIVDGQQLMSIKIKLKK